MLLFNILDPVFNSACCDTTVNTYFSLEIQLFFICSHVALKKSFRQNPRRTTATSSDNQEKKLLNELKLSKSRWFKSTPMCLMYVMDIECLLTDLLGSVCVCRHESKH